MDDVTMLMLVGLIIGTCGRYSAIRGLGWVAVFIGFVIMVAIRVVEMILMVV